MGCGCGNNQVTSPFYSSMSIQGVAGSLPSTQYEVTYPDGRKELVDYETEAYTRIRLTGGTIKMVARVAA